MTQPSPQRQPTDVGDVFDRIDGSLDRILAVTLMAKLAST